LAMVLAEASVSQASASSSSFLKSAVTAYIERVSSAPIEALTEIS
jgi:hypothetical protein